MTIGLIWAQARGRVVGADGGLPWHLPEDLALFKALTMSSTVVMGRATWDSLPEKYRPLPGRRNVVLTRDPHWYAPGAEVAHSVEVALATDENVWVIGGASAWAAALPYADRAVVTEIDLAVSGDTYAPELGEEWDVSEVDPALGDDGSWLMSRTGLAYRVVAYSRRTSSASRGSPPIA